MLKNKQNLTQVEKEVLVELGDKLGVNFVVGKGPGTKSQVILSSERIKVKITNPELKQRVLDKKSVLYKVKYIKCGKESCSKCPHGPYIYAFWRQGNRVKSSYLGKYI